MGILLNGKNLVKKYYVGGETIYALNDASVEITSGHLTILRGRSGSGKTTLINQLCLLDRPDSGELIFDGKDAVNANDKWRDDFRRKNCGVIFQSVALMPHMTAIENVDFAMRIAGIKHTERRERSLECLSIVGLSNRASHLPAELSGGEQQRVAIARAIAHRPKVIFADEPTAELDTQTGLQVFKVFMDLIEKEEVTIIMTTHDPAFIELSNNIYTMTDGVITDER
ncbi:MAG: ABC transporter ATP-binding protein [Oscillospiraceae bacterium]|nr:ABC transporter ATP-binding protein [Oscillospiraceae bacterium]